MVKRKDKVGGGNGGDEEVKMLLKVPSAGSYFPRAG